MAVPTLTANAPAAGQIQWTAFSIAYGGVSYSVPAYQTDKKYTYWAYNGGSPVLNFTNDLPELADDDLLLFLNRNGLPVNVQFAEVLDGDLIVDGTVLAKAIGAGQITAEHLDAKVLTAGMTITGRIQVGTHRWSPNEGLIIPGVAILPGGPTSQIVSITGTPTGGTFKLVTYEGVQTATIAYNASAATVQTAIQALGGAFAGATVTGGPGPGTAWTVNTVGGAAPLAYINTFTGGTSPTVVVTQGPIVATMTASMTATSMTVQKDFNLLGNTNFIKGTLTLSNGVTRPTAPASAYHSWERVGQRVMSFGPTDYGLTNHLTDSSILLTAAAFFGGGIQIVQKSNGQYFAAVASNNVNNSAYKAWCVDFNPTGGITTLNGAYYVLGYDVARASNWYIYKLNSNFDKIAEAFVGWSSSFTGRPAIGTGGPYVLIGMSVPNNTLRIIRYDQSLVQYNYSDYTTFTNIVSSPISFIGTENYDYGGGGGSEKGVAAVESNSNFVFNPYTGDRQGDTYAFPPAGGHIVRGLYWDGTRFWSQGTDGSLYKHGRNTQNQSLTISYTWADRDAGGTGNHETEETTSPITFVRAARSLLNINTPDAPDSGVTAGGTPDKANQVGIYVAIGADSRRRQTSYGALPGATNGGYLGVDSGGRTIRDVTIDVLDTGTANPPVTNGFSGAANSPGIIKTFGATGGQGFILNGDGSGQWGAAVIAAAGAISFPDIFDTGADTKLQRNNHAITGVDRGNQVVTTNGAGEYAFYFARPFPVGYGPIVMANGGNTESVYVVPMPTKDYFIARFYYPNGTVAANTGVRCYWLAM